MTEQYYIQRKPSNYLGNRPVWWAKGGKGYTAYVQNAERFSSGRALDMVSDNPDKWAAYKCSEIDRRLHLVFDMQDFARLSVDPTDKPNPWGGHCRYATSSPNGGNNED